MGTKKAKGSERQSKAERGWLRRRLTSLLPGLKQVFGTVVGVLPQVFGIVVRVLRRALTWLKQELTTVLKWLKRNLAIVLIVLASVGGGTALSVVATNEHHDLLTILTGLILVVSVALFAAADAAAIYAKPAYDEAVAHLRPNKLALYSLTLCDEPGNTIPTARTADGFDFYDVSLPSAITIRVSFRNVGRASAYCLFNLRVPVECELTPLDDPSSGHHPSTDQRILRLMPTVFMMARYSASEVRVPRGVIVAYAVEVRIPEVAPSERAWVSPPASPSQPDPSAARSLTAWPIQIVVKGAADDEFSIDRSLWVNASTA
jgi:hypothetical protein